MLNNILVWVLSFLLGLFPSSLGLLGEYQRRTFDMDASVNMVMDAIKARDIDALEALMCYNIKQNASDLSDTIGGLIDAIDGEIVEFNWRNGFSYEESRDSGKRIVQREAVADFKTSAGGNYRLAILWEVVNTFKPEERGIRDIVLFDRNLIGQDNYKVAQICVTEGNGSWHD